MRYLEIEINQQCNLKCVGCSHFSNIAPNKVYNISTFKEDMSMFKTKIDTIEMIKILGGEPLLNEDVSEYISYIRWLYPNTEYISVVTNGTLLTKMSPEFWTNCSKNDIIIELSDYGLLDSVILDEIRTLRKVHKVKLRRKEYTHFRRRFNMNGNSNPDVSFLHCQDVALNHCPTVKHGRLYLCPTEMTIDVFNDKYGTEIPEVPGLDIYNATTEEIINYVENPGDMCRWCSENTELYEITQNKAKKEDWICEC